MKTAFKKSFLKAIQNTANSKIQASIISTIEEVEKAATLQQISNLKKLKGFRDYYRIRIGAYRVGLKLENDTFTFVVFDDRKDIYKYFP